MEVERDVGEKRILNVQAHADALGTWGGGMRAPDGQMARRGWEGDGRIDLRSVTNSLRQLPYHVAWQRGYRQAATVLNPTIAIDIALETARDLEDGERIPFSLFDFCIIFKLCPFALGFPASEGVIDPVPLLENATVAAILNTMHKCWPGF